MSDLPTTADNRDALGRFGPGNKASKGNVNASKVRRLRMAMLEAIDEGDIDGIIRRLVKMAIAGDVAAAREVLDRVFGKAREAIELTADVLSTNAVGFDWSKLSDTEKVSLFEMMRRARNEQDPAGPAEGAE